MHKWEDISKLASSTLPCGGGRFLVALWDNIAVSVSRFLAASETVTNSQQNKRSTHTHLHGSEIDLGIKATRGMSEELLLEKPWTVDKSHNGARMFIFFNKCQSLLSETPTCLDTCLDKGHQRNSSGHSKVKQSGVNSSLLHVICASHIVRPALFKSGIYENLYQHHLNVRQVLWMWNLCVTQWRCQWHIKQSNWNTTQKLNFNGVVSDVPPALGLKCSFRIKASDWKACIKVHPVWMDFGSYVKPNGWIIMQIHLVGVNDSQENKE